MRAAPVIDELGSPPSHQDRTGRVQLVDQLSGRPEELPVRSDAPVVQPFAAVSQAPAELIVGPAMYPSSDIDM